MLGLRALVDIDERGAAPGWGGGGLFSAGVAGCSVVVGAMCASGLAGVELLVATEVVEAWVEVVGVGTDAVLGVIPSALAAEVGI